MSDRPAGEGAGAHSKRALGTISIRALLPEDWSEVADIYRQGIETGDATFETEVPAWEEWDRSKEPHSRLVAVAEELNGGDSGSGRERIVGFAALSPVSGRCCYAGVAEVMVYVGAPWRGRGLGRKLLSSLIESGERNGIWTMLAGIFPENAASVRIHDALGFRLIGSHRRIGRMADGRWRDTLLLERRSELVGVDSGTGDTPSAASRRRSRLGSQAVRSHAMSTAQRRSLVDNLGADRLKRGAALAPLTTFRIGGPAELLYEAHTAEELASSVLAARRLGVPHFVMGRGANILVGDRGFRGLIVLNRVAGIDFLAGGRVRAGAGVDSFPDLINATVERGLGGLHHFVGIPSSIGGALWQNLHFLEPEPARKRTVFIEEVLEEAEILSEEGERRTVPVEYFEFGYDRSILHERDDIVLSATFRLAPAPKVELRRVMRENLEWRDERHPDLWLYPSAGSIFKKIEGVGAGRLIDECGLKGRVDGAAAIFHKHANIIVNLGGATAAEVRRLIDLARETVARERGHELVTEIDFIGEF